ncbi:glucosamine--fructose-6-phosphate aminotransferase (isomerizing) [Roseimicrobium gellanilyticum]|uniref:Glutamine--fructose-6-phosphate aminotransferase [isomerizing] n=1 Tax=Roseimicrobium gellanilyticum TaxID=748857 RepID=A0A366HUP9_9BACT|nr:glutamine--fructose-6-phosphate transaminase (isomerizing) [Roseimicrobium gellanilyticum]RBP48002.1 glucosamine--fructose-6-phosphate aminotransferase (isomerizing) [Roseimicrobium gellanilyticum]
MCGIVGYIGKRQASPILLDGLRRLEYRGYDSAGMALQNGGSLDVLRRAGRIENLRQLVAEKSPTSLAGISHTRWATHGAPTDENAHPHCDQSGKLALVHNGVIENYQSLKDFLKNDGHTFASETDTEVLAHLIGYYYDKGNGDAPVKKLVSAVQQALGKVKGTYGIAVIHTDCPEYMVGARLGSPLVVGLGQEEHFLASDVSAIIAHTKEVIYLNDYDVVTITRDSFDVQSLEGGAAKVKVSTVDFTEDEAEKGDFPHFMLKEIYEQPQSLRNAIRGRLSRDEATAVLGGLQMNPQELRQIDRIILSACGTACHAGMVGEYLIETLARIPTEVEIASEFRYRNVPTTKDTLQFVISQSGETIDTLAALREAKRKGIKCLGIVNNVASTIARESDGGIYIHAGPEIGVAATKSFTSQVAVLTLLSLLLGRIHHLSSTDGLEMIDELEAIPDKITEILKQASHIKEIAEKYAHVEGMLFMGRLINYPVALEGALKMKEISYIYASGHPSAELKHGVIALVKPELPSVFIAPHDAVFEKNISNIQEVKARKGPVIAVATEGHPNIEKVADDVIYIPRCPSILSPLLTAIPLQLLSYYVALARGCDVDKPRNLAKSVTVE